MKCWVCSREARGFGITDTRYRIGDARRYPVRWVFCSKRCQDGFHSLYSVRVEAESKEQELPMIDATEFEQAAIRGCLKAFGEAAGEIGYTKPLGDYSPDAKGKDGFDTYNFPIGVSCRFLFRRCCCLRLRST